MLQQFFAVFIVFIIMMIVFMIINLVPVWRFLIRAESVIRLYGVFKNVELLETEFSEEEPIEISYGKYKLKFANTNEASIEFEKLTHEALEYYDKLGQILIVYDIFKSEKDELIRICSEVRTLRWQKQGV